ncbi:probable F-box protein At2g36090 [Phoenix dactylifera]|uniref:Probable F-box protein At2g36090 n=1 Tax=Phoenix dactylifera TaxID=42345 RepID=A0A8B7CI49_PHODC|nr:probable F-box protein At2g36090 [Phoenix dactylifera]
MATEPTAVGRGDTTIEDLHEDVLTRALRLLDGPALAASSCATARLRSLSTQPQLWRDLCLATWPSLRHPRLLRLLPSFHQSHRSFFSDAHPFPYPRATTAAGEGRRLTELISAVDLYRDGDPICSRVVETETTTLWFQGAPFRIDALDRKDPAAATPVISPAELTLSWVVIDPVGLRAVNLSSRRPVSVDRHWYTGETLVRFATVLEAKGLVYSAGVVVTCGEETGHVREASLTVESMDGTCLSGRDTLEILGAALEGQRRRETKGETMKRYEEFVKAKRRRKERKARREGMLDMFCTALGVSVFLSFLLMVAFK